MFIYIRQILRQCNVVEIACTPIYPPVSLQYSCGNYTLWTKVYHCGHFLNPRRNHLKKLEVITSSYTKNISL